MSTFGRLTARHRCYVGDSPSSNGNVWIDEVRLVNAIWPELCTHVVFRVIDFNEDARWQKVVCHLVNASVTAYLYWEDPPRSKYVKVWARSFPFIIRGEVISGHVPGANQTPTMLILWPPNLQLHTTEAL
jgi:hypothetical protein